MRAYDPLHLNLPILDQLSSCRRLLIAGTGGGFDVFCGLPIYFELRQLGHEVHLANFSQTSLDKLKGALRATRTLVGVTASQTSTLSYFPELFLAQWLKLQLNEDVTIWCFERTGVQPLLQNYHALIDYLSIDGILLVDGGVDSLMHGDEAETGSMAMDSTSLAVLDKLEDLRVRLLACLGFGAEREVTYAHVLENIAELTDEGAFLGSCSLLKQMECYQFYEGAVLHAQGNPQQRPSIINSSVVSAVQGHYADYHLTPATHGKRLWISPFMPIYWFFDLPSVTQRNLLLPTIGETNTLAEVHEAISQMLRTIPRRARSRIPLP
jgi:hypothetical protein